MDRRDRQRMQVHIVQIRAQDAMPGDVVNRTGPVREGWIEIAVAIPSGMVKNPMDVEVLVDGPADFVDFHAWLTQ